MRTLLFYFTLIACLFTACETNPGAGSSEATAVEEDAVMELPEHPVATSEETGYANSFLRADFEFDTTGWVLQDKTEFLAALTAYAGRRVPMKTDNILALYGKSATVMEQPYFMVSVMQMSRTPSFSELSKGVGTEYMTAKHMKSLAGKENRDLLAGLEADKPIIDKEKERIIIRTSNTQDGEVISSLSTTMIAPGGVLNITGSYMEDQADELLKAYGDVLESLEVRKR